MAEPQHQKYPNLHLAQHIYQISSPSSSKESQELALKALQDAIRENKMAPLYRHLAHPAEGVLNTMGEGTSAASHPSGHALRRTSSAASTLLGTKHPVKAVDLAWDAKLYEELKADNEKELETIQKEQDDAAEQAGETEVQAARAKRAEFWARVGDKEKALEAFEALFEKTGAVGAKIDVVFAIIRIGLFFGDKILVQKTIERANTLVESGGDWDRRNRLKAYQGLHLITTRSYNLAAPLLLDSLSTFTSYELCSYSSLIVYAVLAGTVSLKRVDFKSKVVDAPEIKAVVGSGDDKTFSQAGGDEEMTDVATATPTAVNLTMLGQSGAEEEDAKEQINFKPLALLVSALYNGNYRTFFTSLAAVEQNFLGQDRYLNEHKAWYVREMRLRAYQQLLQSYRVVSLSSMANDFGVSIDFLDKDLKNFVAADRVSCTVDRVNGIIETNRPDDKNKQYHDVVKQGDQLITKLQKYGQAVRLRGSERS